MKLCSSIVLRPLCFLFLLALSSFVISKLYLITKNIDRTLEKQSQAIHKNSILEVESTAKLLTPLNSSALNLARALGTSLGGIELDFEDIQTKIAPTLFVALSTIPHVSQVAYIGLDGVFFSFYNNGDEIFALFSNSSSTHAAYTQTVNRDNGKLYGEANTVNSTYLVGNTTMFQEALKDRKVISTLLDVEWSKGKKLFVYCVGVDGQGMISMGFPSKVATDYFTKIDFRGGFFHLASDDGKVIVDTREEQGLPKEDFPSSCKMSESEKWIFNEKFGKNKYKPNCASIDIAGISSVYFLGYPDEDFDIVVFKKNQIARTLVVVEAVIILVSVCIFLVLIVRLARREMFLCAALIKQMEATQQAERKSMKKSLTFAKTSHDIRGSLSSITCLIELIQENRKEDSGLLNDLECMDASAKYLQSLLKNLLDTSKLEAGKMELIEEEFNLVQLIEESVYIMYPVGMTKGVDVIFDACDGSIFTSYHVKGDRLKCQQILCNLLSNAVKFTDKGHVTVRAMVKKPSIESDIISSNRQGVMKFLSKLYCKNCSSLSVLDDIHTVGQKPGDVEFVIEVEDTGRGIKKEKYKSVFEDFVHAEETALGQGGSGLGLGIVQSLVRLMGGEIKIVDKEHGKKGTCFAFNIFLTASHNESNLGQEQVHRYKNDDGFWFDFLQNAIPQTRSPSHKSEVSHVVLAMASEGRRTISKHVIENLGIKVTIVDEENNILHVISDIKNSLCSSKPNSPDNNELCYVDYIYKSDSSRSLHSYDVHGKKTKLPSSFTLFIIDSFLGYSPRLTSALNNFKKEVPSSMCNIVLLDPLVTRSENPKNYESFNFDHIVTKPFHGSCLYQILGLLPEFGGVYRSNSQILEIGDTKEKGISFEVPLEEIVTHKHEEKDMEKPLMGKKALVVDDDRVLQMKTSMELKKLGAQVDVCKDGKDAYDHVCKVLGEQRIKGNFQELPYDYIFMDCEMKVMDGYEATKRIRMEEKNYSFYFPIIALSSHEKESEEGERRTKYAGMDYFLEKPLGKEKLLEAIAYVNARS